MIVGALIDLGLDVDALRAQLATLPVDGFEVEVRQVERASLRACKVDVVVGGRVEGPGGAIHAHPHAHGCDAGAAHSHGESRSLEAILDVIDRSGLTDATKDRSRSAFHRLASAEARAHGKSPEAVHFHEVGAIDAIVDVTAAMAGFEMLGVERFLASSLNVGSGTVTFSHGTYPVPGPATAELLRGVPVYSGAVRKELVTPTGAAILTTVVESYGLLDGFTIDRVGYGAGTRDEAGHPNVLRALLGTTEVAGAPSARVAVIEASIDDMTPEALGYFVERAMAEGALDVAVAPVTMKKSRPGAALTLLVEPRDLDRMCRLVFCETTTIGLRHHEVSRRVLDRSHVVVATAAGPIRMKIARLDGAVVNAAPEFEDCREAASRTGVPMRQVQAMALAAYREGQE